MKLPFFLIATLLTLSSSAFANRADAYTNSFDACKSDGCDIARNDQVAAVLSFLRTSEDLQGVCNGLNASLLGLQRADETTFSITCGEGPKDNEKILLKLIQNEDLNWSVQIKK